MTRIFNSLHEDDYFGYICIGNENKMPCPQLKLEKKGSNFQAKKVFMDEITDDDFYKNMTNGKRCQSSLNQALYKSVQW